MDQLQPSSCLLKKILHTFLFFPLLLLIACPDTDPSSVPDPDTTAQDAKKLNALKQVSLGLDSIRIQPLFQSGLNQEWDSTLLSGPDSALMLNPNSYQIRISLFAYADNKKKNAQEALLQGITFRETFDKYSQSPVLLRSGPQILPAGKTTPLFISDTLTFQEHQEVFLYIITSLAEGTNLNIKTQPLIEYSFGQLTGTLDNLPLISTSVPTRLNPSTQNHLKALLDKGVFNPKSGP